MENFVTITKILRKYILDTYKDLEKEFDLNIFDEQYNDDEFDEYKENFDEQYDYILFKLSEHIKENKYSIIIYLVLFNDAYESIKSKQIANINICDFEQEILENLEDFNIYELLKKANTSEIFLLDLIDLYLEYNITNSQEEIEKNKKLIELSKNSKYIDKFKINILDNIQKQYTKTRKIY